MNNGQTPLQKAAAILSNDWQAGKVEPVTTASEKDWIQSRIRAYHLADATDARAARKAAQAAQAAQNSVSSSTRIRSHKAKQGKKHTTGMGTGSMFVVIGLVLASFVWAG